jgi:hypothetical protein
MKKQLLTSRQPQCGVCRLGKLILALKWKQKAKIKSAKTRKAAACRTLAVIFIM